MWHGYSLRGSLVFVRSFDFVSECHHSLSAKAHIADKGPSDDIKRLVRMLGYAVLSVAVELNEDVVERVTKDTFYNDADLVHSRCERA
jgi:hypothetical protein